MIRYDLISIGAELTPEGWIKDRPVVTRSGIFEYRRADGTIRREYRPPEEVFKADSLASMHGIPVCAGHPGHVTADLASHNIGTVLSPGEREREDSQNVVSQIVIHNPKLMGDRKELSLAYSLKLDETPGEIDGQKYDAVQRDIHYNHLAVVKRGRAGVARLRMDSAEDAASGDIELEGSRPMAKLNLDGIDYEAAPEVANHVGKLGAQLAASTKRADGLEAERDALKVKVDGHAPEITKARKDGAEDARNRIVLEGAARAILGDAFKADSSDRDTKVAVIEKVNGKGAFKFDGKSDDYVQAIFDMALQTAKERQDASGSQMADINGGYEPTYDPAMAGRSDSADKAWEKSNVHLMNAWKGEKAKG